MIDAYVSCYYHDTVMAAIIFINATITYYWLSQSTSTFAWICCISDHWNEKSSWAVGRTDGMATQNPEIFWEGVMLSTIPGKLEMNKSHCPALDPFR